MVSYVGSPYHKTVHTKWGPPRKPADKSACPSTVSCDDVESRMPDLIAGAIKLGHCSTPGIDEWPRYVWGRSSFAPVDDGNRADSGDEPLDLVWEARLVNEQVGEYKAYPITPDRHAKELPPSLRRTLWEV